MKAPFLPGALLCVACVCPLLLCACGKSHSGERAQNEDQSRRSTEAAKSAALGRHAGAVEFKAARGALRPKLTVDLQEVAERGTLFWAEFSRFDVVKKDDKLQLHIGSDGGSQWLILDCSTEQLETLRSSRRIGATRPRLLAFFSLREIVPMRFEIGAEINSDGEYTSALATMEFLDGVVCRGSVRDVVMIAEPQSYQ